MKTITSFNIERIQFVLARESEANIMAEVSCQLVYEEMKNKRMEGQKLFPFHGTPAVTKPCAFLKT